MHKLVTNSRVLWLGLIATLSFTQASFAADNSPGVPELERMTARFAPVDVEVDLKSLPDNERAALTKLVEASRYVDALFMRQRSAGNEALLLELLADSSADGRARLGYFLLNKGPWSELDEDRPFLPGIGPKLGSGNFYPANTSREEVEKWMATLSGTERARATGFFTTIRRGANGAFQSLPYSIEYQGELAEMTRLLREAATLTKQPTLKAFLEKRADAFLSNDYYASDVA